MHHYFSQTCLARTGRYTYASLAKGKRCALAIAYRKLTRILPYSNHSARDLDDPSSPCVSLLNPAISGVENASLLVTWIILRLRRTETWDLFRTKIVVFDAKQCRCSSSLGVFGKGRLTQKIKHIQRSVIYRARSWCVPSKKMVTMD